MTAEEIAAEDARLTKEGARKIARARKPGAGVTTVELSESGVLLYFPMSAKEIRLARKKESREVSGEMATRNELAGKNVGVFELAESSLTINFTRPSERSLDDNRMLAAK
jgi:hypothetical protein